MVQSGLVSVTFRALPPAEIVALVRRAGLRGIEWGGDIHVPHGDLGRAREVRELTQEAGLAVAAYGSYYRAGQSEGAGLPFARVLETAVELGAPTVRVWAGTTGSASAGPEVRAHVATDLHRIAALAADAHASVSLEFHSGTLTDTAESAIQLLRAADHPGLLTYWQPPLDLDTADSVWGLRSLLPWLSNLHVYHWRPTSTDRLPLDGGGERWRVFLDAVAATADDRYAMIEFVERDAPESFLRDAATLKSWLEPAA